MKKNLEPSETTQLELWPLPELADDEVIMFGQIMKVGQPYDMGPFRICIMDTDYTIARGNKTSRIGKNGNGK